MSSLSFTISDKTIFQEKLLHYFQESKYLIFFNSNSEKENLLAVCNSDEVRDSQWKFGFISYDYKNHIEKLESRNTDNILFPEKYFFSPELLFKISEHKVEVQYEPTIYNQEQVKLLFKEIEQTELNELEQGSIKILPRLTKEEYLQKVKALQHHIQLGDIYEVNFCQEFYAEQVEVTPFDLYLKLNEKSPTPFSCFVKYDDKYLMCASPERFIKKTGDKLISQPIKGTIKRGQDELEDIRLKEELLNDPKEQSENVMIVDLVRNDLAKVAKKGTVEVEELFGIYSFPQVHQMISTVTAKLESDMDFESILKATFPMGSMTGAPKIRAMELIEKHEITKRGIYSGAVGYIDENGDFDFNVVIRGLTYNRKNNYLSFIVGGAITANSIPEKEYDECLLKAKAIMEVLSNND